MLDYSRYNTETVIVTERNDIGQTTAEYKIERTFQDGVERQTTARVTYYDLNTGKPLNAPHAASPTLARELITNAEKKGMLS